MRKLFLAWFMRKVMGMAQNKYIYAQLALGRMYEEGYEHIKKDREKAIEWYRKASEHDDPYGHAALARLRLEKGS